MICVPCRTAVLCFGINPLINAALTKEKDFNKYALEPLVN